MLKWHSLKPVVVGDTVQYTLKAISNMFDLAFVTPKSKKAKNRFANLMNHNPECVVEQINGNRVFLRSINNRNFFWVSIINDNDWMIDF